MPACAHSAHNIRVAAVSPSAAETMNSAASPARSPALRSPTEVGATRGIDQIEFQPSYAVGASVRLMERCWRISTGS